MSTIFMTSIKKINKVNKYWTVDVESDDNEIFSYDITASSAEEAANEATTKAANQGIYNIYSMNVYAY